MKLSLHLTYLFVILVLILILLDFPLSAQRVGNDAYIKGTNIEIGLDGAGGFEGCDINTSPPPAGMHFRSNTFYFGFVANPQRDGWVNYDGDFFTPGTPRNGWGIEVPSMALSRGNNRAYNPIDIPGSLTEWSHTYDCYSSTWESDVSGIHISINYFLQETDLFYTTTIKITNNTGALIPELFYYRSLDPDNNIQINGNDYATTNKIEDQPGSGSCNVALVSASQSVPWSSYLGLAAIGTNWRAGYGGITNIDGSDLWNGIGHIQTVGSSDFIDEEIYLANRIQNLAPGTTETIKFVVILDRNDASRAINNLVKLAYPGSGSTLPSACTPYTDTVKACQDVLTPIQIQGAIINNFNWVWSPMTDLTSIRPDSVNLNPTSNITYTVTGTPINSCFLPISMSFVLKVLPSTSTAVPDSVVVCSGDNVPITNFISTPAGAPFTWTNSNTAIGLAASGNGNVPSFTASNSTANAISATITVYTGALAGTCSAGVKTYKITVNPKPSLTITDPAALCSPATADITLANSPSGIFSYWNDSLASNPITNPTTIAVSGKYFIKIVNNKNCSNTQAVNVKINPSPSLTINHPLAVCAPFNIDLTSPAITAGSDNASNLTYWSDEAASSALTSSNAIATSGTYFIKASSGACASVKAVIVKINAFPLLTITNPAGMCEPAIIDFTAPAITAGSTAGLFFSYWNDNAATDPLLSPNNITSNGNYYIKATTTEGCSDIKTVTSTVFPMPNIAFLLIESLGCSPLCINFPNIQVVPENKATIARWKWKFGDGQTDTGIAPTHCFTASGQYDISAQATSNEGCSTPELGFANMVTVSENPSADFTAPSTSISNPDVQFTNNSQNASVHLWDFGDLSSSTNSSNEIHPHHIYADTGYYCVTLKVSSDLGCKDSAEHCLIVFPETKFFIPNSFSPNADGVNDFFFAKGSYVSDFEMMIFNRWGSQIFHCNDINTAWNGRVNNSGEIVQEDVYVYFVKLKDADHQHKSFTGSVTVIK